MPALLNQASCAPVLIGSDRDTGLSLCYVAGDVTSDGAIIWLRAAPGSEVVLHYSSDRTFNRFSSAGPFRVDESADHTAKIELQKLDPGTTYFYYAAVAGKKPGYLASFLTAPASSDAAKVSFCFSGDSRESYQPFTIMNAVRAFLPHLLALSVNSPFWCGRKTGVKSVRSTIFKRFPRTQIPEYFRSWHEYQKFVDLLVRTNCIDDAKKIWWDVRPHAHFKTLEFRICDIPSRMEETIMIAALVQALVCKLRRVFEGNLSFRVYERAIIMENKFRALKRGLDGHLIAFDLKSERPTRELVTEVLDFVDDVVDELGTREEMAHLRVWAHAGDTGADRQISAWENTHDLRAVVDSLVDETRRGL